MLTSLRDESMAPGSPEHAITKNPHLAPSYKEGDFHLGLGVVEQIAEFVGRDVGEIEAAGVQLFVHFDDGLSHDAVSLVGAAGEEEVLAAGDTLGTIACVEGEAQESGDSAFFIG